MSIIEIIRTERRSPVTLIFLLSAGMGLAMSAYSVLLNNYVVEKIGFTGVEIGLLHTIREIPGFLVIGVIYLIMAIREQRLVYLSLILLGFGGVFSGLSSQTTSFLTVAVFGSIGFHVFETVRQSLTLQWVEKERTPVVLGQIISVHAFTALVSFSLIFVLLRLNILTMSAIYILTGLAAVAVGLVAWIAFPSFSGKVEQTKKLVLRKRYWLFYLLTFLAGGRRQIITVFAGFLMVERFGFSASSITLMFLANHMVNMFLAPKIGKLIQHWGERRTLLLEYAGLIFVFSAYAFVQVAWVAVALFIVDHIFFTMAIAIKTYFQKIADPADMANTAGVSSAINHVAAVGLPMVLGLIWMVSPSYVFLIGTGIAAMSFCASILIPTDPAPGNEIVRPKLGWA